MTFRVGQMVVCAKRGAWSDTGGEVVPVYRGIYTIREIEIDECDLVMLRFVEIVNAPRDYWQGHIEARFWAKRFRPLVHDTTKAVEAIKASLPKLKSREKVET